MRETPMSCVAPRDSYYRVPYGPGWMLVGDAGYFKDPITGQGIHDALRSAELAANAYTEYRAGAEWKSAMQKFQATRDRETIDLYRFTDLFAQVEREFSQQEMDLFRALAGMPRWADRYVSMFNGVTNVRRFISTPNLLRIMTEWRVRQAWQRVTGRNPFRSTEKGTLPA